MRGQLISVIVPVYNVAEYVEECITSILCQTYEDIQIVIIDDGSSDESGKICDRIARNDNRIVVFHQENKGLSVARNRGIENAQGEYLAFIDSDDLLAPNFLEVLYTAMLRTDADIAQCDMFPFSDKQKILPKQRQHQNQMILTSREANQMIYIKRKSEYTVVCNKLFKKTLFKDIRFPAGKIHEDTFTTHKIYYKADRIVVVESQLYFYRHRRDSLSKTISYRNMDMLDAYEERLRFYQELQDMELYFLCMERYMFVTTVIYRKMLKLKDENVIKLLEDKAQMIYAEMKENALKFRDSDLIKYGLFIRFPKMYVQVREGMIMGKKVIKKIVNWGQR
uniref:glycosyltransferase family 2 protein n=1 Tax=Acetatifactor sp. TaxID=1872090 RepID=UPI004055FE8A